MELHQLVQEISWVQEFVTLMPTLMSTPTRSTRRGARVSEYFITKNPNLKRKAIFFGRGGGVEGAKVSDLF